MKNKIIEILNENLSISQSGYMNCQSELEGKEDAAEEITQIIANMEAETLRYCAKYTISQIKKIMKEDGLFSGENINKAVEKLQG